MIEGSLSNRFHRFLDNYSFFPNSIEFRISSSKAIEKWKNTQSFQLNQIVNGKFQFHPNEKEVFLLKYDMWSRMIYEIESLMIELSHRNHDGCISTEEVDFVIELSDKTLAIYEEILTKKHPHRFNKDFLDIWRASHSMMYNLMIHQIRGIVGYDYEIAFSMLTDIISKGMQYTLIELHELHELNALFCFFDSYQYVDGFGCKSNSIYNIPFMIITDMDHTSKNLIGEYMILDRLKIYREYFDIKELYFKNYSANPIPIQIFDTIEDSGVNINYKLNY